MKRVKFVRPSPWRLFWSVVAATFIVYAVWVIVVYALGIFANDGPPLTSINDCVGFLMFDLIFAGPGFGVVLWFITLPAIATIASVIACARRTKPADRDPSI